MAEKYKFLDNINKPSDIRNLSIDELTQLAAEIRDFLINSVSKTGGHLASNLGAVELTIALHKVFDSPNDKLVFDVGHQCYTHKLLTNRKQYFKTLRKKDGLSGFPKTRESNHDAFISGHSSTSISAALGIATAFKMQQKNNYAVAIIGDGAFTGGQVYEALNNAGRSKTQLIVILNHNDMSISKNVGAFSKYLTTIRSRPSYLKLKTNVSVALNKTPVVGKPLQKLLESSKSRIKTMIYRSTFFEQMGFSYLGPMNGHNIQELIQTLSHAKELKRPVVIQIETKKGKGYSYAEANPGEYHAISKFDPLVGANPILSQKTYSNAFGITLKKIADKDNRVCAITAAMKYGTGLQYFKEAHRDRFFDVGIAESHAVTFAGGLSSQGFIPVFAVYSSFLQRSFDQIIQDISMDCQHVVLAVDRAGIVGEDGETHQGIFDVAFLSEIPNMKIYSPEGYAELEICLQKAVLVDTGVCAVRYPRGVDCKTHNMAISTDFSYKDNGSNSIVISYGRTFSNCFDAAKILKNNGKDISLLKLTQIFPIKDKIINILLKYSNIYFVEEGIKNGSIAQQIASMLLEKGYCKKMKIVAIENKFVDQGTVPQILSELKMDTQSIVEMINQNEQ